MNACFNLYHALLLEGVIQFAILTASALVPRVLDWKNALKPLPPFLRTLFWVYGVFIVLMIISLGTLSLLHAEEIACGDAVARSVAVVTAIFWGARLLVQIFIFDARPWLTTVSLKLGYHALTVAFIYLTALYTYAALHA